jgi:peptide/nickel transport system substrate-binding protein
MMRLAERTSTPVLVWLLLLCAACGAPARAPDTIVYASGADLESANPLVTIHPLARQVQRHVLLVTLARYDAALEPEPYAARRWTWSADRTALTFELVEGIRWHDGTPTTAHDVVFTIDAARDPATGFPRSADLAEVVAVRADDEHRVTIAFARPQAGFPLVLCELPIGPVHLLGQIPRGALRQAAYGREPVGNGPFRFVSRTPGQRWVFERDSAFPAELGGPPVVRRLVVAVVDEATTKFAGLVAGALDVAGIAPTMAEMVARDRSLRVLDYPVLFSTAVIFNVHRAPLDDPRVRRALSAAIDRQRIVGAALAGYGVPADGPVSSAHPWALPAVGGAAVATPTTPASLLDAAGWRLDAAGRRVRDGQPLVIEMLTVGGADAAVEQLLQADFARLGVRLEIRQRELAAFLAEARSPARNWDAIYTGIPGDLSLSYLAAMYHSRQSGGTLDYSGYHAPELDVLFMTLRAVPADEAAPLWAEVQQHLAEAAPAAWIYHARGVQGLAASLDGVVMDLRGELVSITRWQRRDTPQRTARQ